MKNKHGRLNHILLLISLSTTIHSLTALRPYHDDVMDSEFLSVISTELNSRRYSSRRSCRIGLTDEIRGFVNSPAKTEVLKARHPDELNRLKPQWQKTCSQIHHKLSPRRGKLQCKHGIRSRLGLSFFTPPSQKKNGQSRSHRP